ncbi:unnamed protein product [Lactuca virosa]|uniref:Uncharacterized protein n=1 Tax=Lactuca virosa TaxID=75947 RepID=A0AAU9N7F0_9ASTR|nr:unnamed protein product [Lactuca virosa]
MPPLNRTVLSPPPPYTSSLTTTNLYAAARHHYPALPSLLTTVAYLLCLLRSPSKCTHSTSGGYLTSSFNGTKMERKRVRSKSP